MNDDDYDGDIFIMMMITLASLDCQQKVSWWFWFMKMPLMIADCYDDKYANVAITTVS